MATINDAFSAMADINLWLSVNDGDALKLTDIPNIIPLRWTYFQQNWNFIKPIVLQNASGYVDPALLNQQIISFTNFINSQANTPSNINPFSNGIILNRFYTIFDNILIQDINPTNQETIVINDATQRVQLFTKNDFVNARSTIINYRDAITDTYGLTDPTYNSVTGRSPVAQQITADIPQINFLKTIQDTIKSTDFILANLFAVDQALNPFALAAANANNPDINIGQYSSGKLVRLFYGESLANLANRYFGDANRWLDIAIANGLKAPYIDEIGTTIPLLANADGNQINIPGVDQNGNSNLNKIYINQPIFIQSNVYPVPNQLSVINIRQVPVSGEIIIQLSGNTNLNQYRVADSANIRVFLPATTNSSFYILIPSQEPLTDSRSNELPWFLQSAAADEIKTKVDIAIDDNSEINFTTNNDLQLSYSLANAVQAIRLMIITELGSLRYHPTYGLVNIIGKTNANITQLKDALTQSLITQIQADDRFDRVETLNVNYGQTSVTNTSAASAIYIDLTVRLAGSSQVIPISFTVQT